MRRGQILGQVFLLILASVVFIMILLYGYRAISQFTTRSEQVALVDFENSFRNGVKAISLDFGSVKRLDLSTPRKHRELCIFCSPGMLEGCDPSPQFQQDHPLLYESWQGGSENVFLTPFTAGQTPILIDRLQAKDGGFCTNIVDGRVSLRLEGLGDRTLVGPWPTAQP